MFDAQQSGLQVFLNQFYSCEDYHRFQEPPHAMRYIEHCWRWGRVFVEL